MLIEEMPVESLFYSFVINTAHLFLRMQFGEYSHGHVYSHNLSKIMLFYGICLMYQFIYSAYSLMISCKA